MLSGSLATTPSAVDLTLEGTLDWAHWGRFNATSFNHRSGVTQQISNYVRIGNKSAAWFGDNNVGYSWSNGTPTATSTNTTTGIWISGLNNGFQITVPADTTLRTLRVYVGVAAAQGKLTVTLSDGSAPTYVDTGLISPDRVNGVYTINFQAGSSGQQLVVKWTTAATFVGWGNVTLQAATLFDAGGPPTNQGPIVSAGSDQNITLPNTVNLNGTATDDGLPSGTLTILWSMVSGPGTVTFGNPNQAVTSASFSTAGTYVLELNADDSQLSDSDQVTITVLPANQPPTVSAGTDQTISLPAGANLNGTVSDDGLPNPPATLATTWSKVSGPGTVNFSNPNQAVTSASFSTAGTYVLALNADDSQLSDSDQVTITVLPANQPPTVSAGTDQTIGLPAGANLNGTVSDDGLPNPPATVATTWSKVSGPGTVTFANANVVSTTATFSLAGQYVLRLTADDSALSSSDDVAVTVNGAGVLSGSLATTPSAVDLTLEGTLDWAHWGRFNATSFNRRSGVTQQISNYVRIGNKSAAWFGDNNVGYSWSNGTPTATSTNTTTGIWISGLNNGFQITVPAGTTLRTLRVYVGVAAAQGKLTVTLSDGSAPTYVDTGLISPDRVNGVYTINFQAGSSGQQLVVKWTTAATFMGWGNVTLQAATLQ